MMEQKKVFIAEAVRVCGQESDVHLLRNSNPTHLLRDSLHCAWLYLKSW